MNQKINISAFRRKTGIKIFNANLLKLALTHRSVKGRRVKHKDSNERVEFLGDAVLEFIVSKALYNKFPEEEEGFLTKVRSALVCEKNLSKVGKRLGIGEFIRMGRGILRRQNKKLYSREYY